MAQQTTPRGLRNNNPLNIRKGNVWKGERHTQVDPDFEEFKTLEDGFRAAFILIRNYLRKRPPVNTPRLIISRWAPPSENKTDLYVSVVCQKAVLKPDEILVWKPTNPEKNKICMLVWAMAQVECGVDFSFGRIENAFAMAYWDL
mgnify:CR=1 FL=1